MARLCHWDRGPTAANCQFKDRLPRPQVLEKEWHILLEHFLVLVFGIVVFRDREI